jgi:uncharacterized protein (DUF58 family)
LPVAELTFPLVPRGRLVGLSFGTLHSSRRGLGSDLAGSRPYRPGDDVASIDWNASARLSSARNTDEFIVRVHYAEEAARVVVLCDRRPEMSIFSPSLPWLSKPEAMRQAVDLIFESAFALRSLAGYLDWADGSPFWEPPRSQRRLRQLSERGFRAPSDGLTRALDHLVQRRRELPAGTFLFVLSDFLRAPSEETWIGVLEHRWDIVPVVIQDPVWEQSFPDVSRIVVPLVDPASGRVSHVRLEPREAEARREANESRWHRLLTDFRALDLDPVVLQSDRRQDILTAFLSWADVRIQRRQRPW